MTFFREYTQMSVTRPYLEVEAYNIVLTMIKVFTKCNNTVLYILRGVCDNRGLAR